MYKLSNLVQFDLVSIVNSWSCSSLFLFSGLYISVKNCCSLSVVVAGLLLCCLKLK